MVPVHHVVQPVSHANVDFLGELKVSALLGFLEQVAVEASARAGFDPARYTAEGRVWLVRRTRLGRLVPVGGGELLRIATRVLDFRRARSLRRYEVERAGLGSTPGGGEAVARATTDWVYCDVESGRPVSVPEGMKQVLFGDAAPALERAPRVAVPSDEPPSCLRIPVRPSHLDHMAHVNNAAWADFLEDGALDLFATAGFGLDRMLAAGGALRIRRLDLEYLDEARLGHELSVRSWLDAVERRADGAPPVAARVVQSIGEGGRTLLRAASEWVWRGRSAILGGAPTG